MTFESADPTCPSIDAWIDAQLALWQTAAERQPLIEGRWGPPPALPLSGAWNVAFDPTGRHAILIGADALHLLDLHTARAQLVLDRPGSDRVGAFAPDGGSAVVIDLRRGEMHRIVLDHGVFVTTHRLPIPAGKRDVIVDVDADGHVVLATPTDDQGVYVVSWVDAATGAIERTGRIYDPHFDRQRRLGHLRTTGGEAHLVLDGPNPRTLVAAPSGETAERRHATLGRGANGPWRLESTREGWRLVAMNGVGRVFVDPPRRRIVVSDGPRTAHVAVAVDGRVRVHDRDTGEPIGPALEPPQRARFAEVEAMSLSDEMLWVHGLAAPTPFSAEPRSLLAVYRLDDGRWRFVGSIVLVRRPAGPVSRADVLAMSVPPPVPRRSTSIESAGRAPAPFERPASDPYGREVPVVHAGPFFGRLDDDRALGERLRTPFEHPGRAVAWLRGDALDWDPATEAGVRDWHDRLRFWQADAAWSGADDLAELMEASAGLGHLLPEIVHRATARAGGRNPTPIGLQRVAAVLRHSEAGRPRMFAEMLDRLRQVKHDVARARRLLVAYPALSPSVARRMAEDLGATMDPVIAAIEAGSTALVLRDATVSPDLIALLDAVRSALPLERLDLAGCRVADDTIEHLAAREWPALRALDLSGTEVTDRSALALAGADGLGRLEPLVIDRTDITLLGRALLTDRSLLSGEDHPPHTIWLPLLAWLGAPEDTGYRSVIGRLLDRLVRQAEVVIADPGDPQRRIRWTARDPDGRSALCIEGVALTARALEALAAAPAIARVERLALRRCQLDTETGVAALEAAPFMLGLDHLDLSHNRLGRGFAVELARRAAFVDDARPQSRLATPSVRRPAPRLGRLTIADNPIDHTGWGVLRGAFGHGLVGAPDHPIEQCLAASRLGDVPQGVRFSWLGHALAGDPPWGPRLLTELATWLDPTTQRALLASEDFGRALGPATGAIGPALADWALRLAVDGRTVAWIGDVRCVLDGASLTLCPLNRLTGDRLRVAAEPDTSRLRKLVSGQDVLTGDEAFDRLALIGGDPRLALALLDPVTRAALSRWLPRGLTFGAGVFEMPGGPGLAWWMGGPPEVAALAELAALARRLAEPTEPLPALCLRRLESETDPGVATRLAEVIVGDADTELAALDTVAACPVPAARRLAGQAIAMRLTPGAFETLSPAGLAATLEHAPTTARRGLIARLAEVGDERAVAPLTKLADAFFGTGDVKQAARAAIEAIVKRQGGLRAGGLTVAGEGEAGALSVSEDDR